MTTLSNLAFGFVFNNARLVADPSDRESMHDAMLRTINQHAGSPVAVCGRCKLVNGLYTYPITLENGLRGKVVFEGQTA